MTKRETLLDREIVRLAFLRAVRIAKSNSVAALLTSSLRRYRLAVQAIDLAWKRLDRKRGR